MSNPTIIDSTRVSMGADRPHATRRASDLRRIGIHHTATGDVTRQALENGWRNRGWTNGGYSELIHRNGSVEVCYVPEVVTNGASGTNHDTYHISMVGNGDFTPAQAASLENRIRFNMQRFNIPVARVFAHRELPNQATACVPYDMNALRQRLSRPVTTQPPISNNNVWIVGDANTQVRVTADTLNVRERRNATSRIVRTLKRGDVVHVGFVMGVDNANPIPAGGAAWGNIGNGFINLAHVERVGAVRNHIVVSGDTLWGLSQRFGVSVAAIQGANGMGSSTVLSPGRVLVIPN